jgi:hypothetical protein
MSADFGPCSSWDPIWICDVSAKSPTATGRAVAAATSIVWTLSGRQFGTCTTTLRPCRRTCYDDGWWNRYGMPWSAGYAGSGWAYGGGYYGLWFDLSCGSCSGGCSCSEVSEVVLPSPVSSIVRVMMDGTPMATGAYRVDNNRFLVRTDGQRWPRCNNLSLNDTQPGTWSVTAAYGQDVPVAGQFAVGEMACEILKAMDGEDCRLPAGIQALTRQGVSISYPDIGSLFRKGRTGLYLVDAFITTVNPSGLASRSRVYSVDRLISRRAGT